MNSDQYFHRGLRLIVASVLVFFLIVLFCVMVSRGFPFWMALVLLVPAGLCVAGLYYFSIGTSADLSELFFRRFRCEWPKSDENSIVEEKPDPAVEVTDEKRLDPTVAISDVIPGDPAPETPILENALSTVYIYTDQILGEALDESNRLILRRRLLYLACMAAIPESVPQVRLRGDRIGYGDLCHYGWNVWNAFKGARNQFYDQSELAEWLKSGFESLGKYNTKTLRAKLRATDGGYGIRLVENLKEYLQNNKAVFNNPGIAAAHGIDMPAGIMIVGMPGCGKSLTAKCISKEFGVPLLRLDIGRLMGKYVGESEENLRKAIRVAEATTPCILWIDEIEKAFAGLGSGGEVTTRLFGQFLTWMQEKKSAIYVVATANDISNLPPEFLRRGRFDEIFQVRFPNIKEREAIFKIQLEKRNGKRLPDGVDPHALAVMLKDQDNYSGADIESIVKESMKRAFVDGQRKVTQQDLQEIIRNTKSSYQSQKEKLDKMLEKLNSLGVKPASR